MTTQMETACILTLYFQPLLVLEKEKWHPNSVRILEIYRLVPCARNLNSCWHQQKQNDFFIRSIKRKINKMNNITFLKFSKMAKQVSHPAVTKHTVQIPAGMKLFHPQP